MAMAKAVAVRLKERLSSMRRISVVVGKRVDSGERVVAVGPQDLAEASYQVFPEECCIPMVSEKAGASVCAYLLDAISENAQLYHSLLHYSTFSGNPVPNELAAILQRTQDASVPCFKSHDHATPWSVSSPTPAQPYCGSSTGVLHCSRNVKGDKSKPELFVLGAGSYVQAYVLPYLRQFSYHTIVDLNPRLAHHVGRKHRFRFIDTSASRALLRLKDAYQPVVVVATYHSTHLPLVERALDINPDVRIIVEKPPVATWEQLTQAHHLGAKLQRLEVGYNRRYAPFVRKAIALTRSLEGPISMTCIIKELCIPKSHWYYWPSQGTRVLGNLCHWIDLGCYFIASQPTSLSAHVSRNGIHDDELTATVNFEDGSRLTLVSTQRGNQLRGVQELIDIRRDDLTVTIRDFVAMDVQRGRSARTHRSVLRDKGHRAMYREFCKSVLLKTSPQYSLADLCRSTSTTLAIVESVLTGLGINQIPGCDFECQTPSTDLTPIDV